MRRLLLAALLLLPSAAAAQTVGPTCTLSWIAPTANADGTLLTKPIQFYNIWVTTTATPVPVPGVTPVTATVAAPTTTWNCAGVGLGQHYVWVAAWNGTDSAVSTTSTAVPPVAAAPLAFTLVGIAPASPSGLKVTP